MKSIKYSYGTKTVAFFLAVVCVFSAAWYTQMIVKTLDSYGWNSKLTQGNVSFTDSAMFNREVVELLDNLYQSEILNDWERDVLPAYDTLEEEQAYVLEQFERFKADIRQQYAENAESVTDAYGDAQETTAAYTLSGADAAGETPSGFVVTIPLNSLPTAEVTLYSDDSESYARQAVEEIYTSTLANYRREFESSVLQAQQAVNRLKNAHYLICNSATGEVYSNLENVRTEAAFTEQVSAEDWFFGYTCARGLTMYSDSLNIDEFYNGSYYAAYADHLNSTFSDRGYDVYIQITMPLELGDSFADAQTEFLGGSSQLRVRCLAAIVLLAAAAGLSLYLVFVTGRVRGREGICLAPGDKLPNDLHFVLTFGLCFAAGAGALFSASYYIQDDDGVFLILGALLSAVIYMLLMEWINSVAKGYKAGRPYFRSTLLAKLFAAWHKANKKFFGALRRVCFARLDSLSKKVRWFALLYLAVDLVLSLLTFAGVGFALFLLLLFNAACLISVWRYVVALDKIIAAAQKERDGETVPILYTENMPQPLRSLAENFSAAQETKEAAIEEALKGERMKTELITNVSHDLKTPLTSIISYVDLLEKCDIPDETAQKYIRVLDEKSGRLKRLIEDLVEASKVSSGAVTLNKMQVNLCELATQAVGEMEDSFAERRLEIVLHTPETPPVIFADSQKTWRIIDNLLNNARKYSLEGTRVYVDVSEENGEGIFSVKNVSAEALNIPPEELTQRFVRGDQSRTNEGSGLGLSIAKDLCTLQGGALVLEIDGDLFKATVRLPKAYEGDFSQERPVPPVSPHAPNARS